MIRKLNKILGIREKHIPAVLMALTALIVLGFTSYIAPGNQLREIVGEKGNYQLASVVDGEMKVLEGPVFYEITEQGPGIQKNRVCKLHFVNNNISRRHTLGFIIPITQNGDLHNDDVFLVESELDGFINKFESVFGYASLEDKGSPLYFTDKGSIKINEISEGSIDGQMNMVLKDSKGNKMALRGNFIALPLPEYQY